MYRTILESLLGLKIRGDKMEIHPCIPKTWTDFSLVYTYKNTRYNIKVLNNSNSFANFPSTKLEMFKQIKVDGVNIVGEVINLVDDGKEHEVEVIL
jgi:cellobiose phosphorylase